MKSVTTYDEYLFDQINTPAKAYFLGLMYADGCVYHTVNSKNKTDYRTSICLQETDKTILERFRKELEWTHDLIFENRNSKNENWANLYKIVLSGKKIHDDLVKWGCVENKSLILTFPTFIDDSLMSHFIRGYFDGDGCIWNGKRKKMIVKDPKCKNGTRERIVHNVKFHFTGSIHFITGLQSYLVNNVGFKRNNLNTTHSRENQSNLTCMLEYSGRGNVKKLYDYMYKDCEDIYIPRKKKKFEEIICAFDEKSSNETGLIAGTPEMVISSQAENYSEGSSTIPEMEVESSDSKCPALTV